jgi:hypothetical protein
LIFLIESKQVSIALMRVLTHHFFIKLFVLFDSSDAWRHASGHYIRTQTQASHSLFADTNAGEGRLWQSEIISEFCYVCHYATKLSLNKAKASDSITKPLILKRSNVMRLNSN